MPVQHGIFYERQSGGRCRMHALNAFFGCVVITPSTFDRYLIKYNNYLQRFNVQPCSFDLVNSDQMNIVSYILRHHRQHLRYYALNELYNKQVPPAVHNASFIFVYNSSHIWGMRKRDGCWYTVNSIGGVYPHNINNITSTRDIGILVPVPMKAEWDIHVNTICDILIANGVTSKVSLIKYLAQLHKSKRVLGGLEIPLGVAISILETNSMHIADKKYTRAPHLINKYNIFIKLFTKKNYNNLELILEHIPYLIMRVISLQGSNAHKFEWYKR